MLPKPPSEVTEDTIREICQQGWPESQTLDFKRELPGRDSRGRNEFLKDVCALANAEGGDLVYGLEQIDGAAKAPAPIMSESIDALRARLLQILDAGLEPRVSGIAMHEVPMDRGFVWIVRVPASFETPHRYHHDGHSRFVVRNGTVTSDMTYDQIRAAFNRSATLSERARRFRRDRCTAIDSGTAWRPLVPGPVAIVHVIPIAAMLSRVSVDVGALHDGNYMAFAQTEPSWGSKTARTLNLDGLVVHPSHEPGTQLFAFSTVFRAGALESVRFVGHARMGDDLIPSTVLATFVRNTVSKLTCGAAQNGYPGPAIVGVSLLRAGGIRLGLGDRYSRPIAIIGDRRDMLLPEAWIPALEGFTDIDSVVRPQLDMLWQCFGEPRCREYDASGRWTPTSPVA